MSKAEAFVVWAELGQAIAHVELQLSHLKQLRLKARAAYEHYIEPDTAPAEGAER